MPDPREQVQEGGSLSGYATIVADPPWADAVGRFVASVEPYRVGPQVSPGPYLEMFARRARFGWDYWGDQSLGTAEMAA